MTRWLTESDIRSIAKTGLKTIPNECRLTPSAKDLAYKLGMSAGESAKEITIAIASDHGGFKLKEQLKASILAKGIAFEDLGCHSEASVDYPDYAIALAKAVAAGKYSLGVMIDTYGIASAIAANKVRGIRATFCPSVEIAKSARGHNDANVLTLGGKMELELAEPILFAFLTEPFLGGRHKRRLDKIKALE
jgi:ribose 5-phosphate isomerase B